MLSCSIPACCQLAGCLSLTLLFPLQKYNDLAVKDKERYTKQNEA